MARVSALVSVFVALIAQSVATSPPAGATSEIIIDNVRVQALSSTLLRIEPLGPRGFENRTTFTVRSREFKGTPIWRDNATSDGILLRTADFSVKLNGTGSPPPSCRAPAEGIDVDGAKRSYSFPHGVRVESREECCSKCESDQTCMAWVFHKQSILVPNCWPLASFESLSSHSSRELGCSSRGCTVMARPSFVVYDNSGSVLYSSSGDNGTAQNLLHWPSPLQATGYALVDFPRFFVPDWALTPIPEKAKLDEGVMATNGYDFRNNINGDTYVFLLGSTLSSWQSSRKEFLQLTGPCPLLPDFAFGTWFTFWHQYSDKEAKADIEHWEKSKLPIDVWGLDMNWRLPEPPLDLLPILDRWPDRDDQYYDRPNPQMLSNATDWFAFLRSKKLRTYFNDHPFPVAARGQGGLQTSKEEVEFRWKGLSKWMESDLTFWWFDHNWVFSIPPPFVNSGNDSMVGLLPPDWGTDLNWQGLDNVAWGSHLYYSTVEVYDRTVRDKAGDKFYGGRPIALTKSFVVDWRPGRDPRQQAEHPSQHRYPVWWSGDNVNLQASVESMVDAGVHSLKPYVHSDCGGDYTVGPAGAKGAKEDLLRWTGHCTFGSILRFHGGDHRPWTYNDSHIEGTIRNYLRLRYRLLPSLITAGHHATETGFPYVARGDLYWPEHSRDSASNQQYIFLHDMLVAPLWDAGKKNETSRAVWIPPGSWEDAWDGSIVEGPKKITARQPAERVPLWYRRDGGLVILAGGVDGDKAMRVDEQDWSSLTIEAWPSVTEQTTHRHLIERNSAARTNITMQSKWSSGGPGEVSVYIEAPPKDDFNAGRAWVVRFHLRPDWDVTSTLVDNQNATAYTFKPSSDHFPLSGSGSAPAPRAGKVIEMRFEPFATEQQVQATIHIVAKGADAQEIVV